MAGMAVPHRPSPLLRRPLTRARLLVADADRSRRALLQLLLERADLPVVAEAADGAEVIAGAASHRPSVVIMDDDLPVRRGVDALPRVRRLVPHALICLTADASVADTARDRGADHVLDPGDLDTLVQRVSDHFVIVL